VGSEPVKRYAFGADPGTLDERRDGYLCWYADHAARIASLEAEVAKLRAAAMEIAREAHMRGRIYCSMGEPEKPADVERTLREYVERTLTTTPDAPSGREG
jgi:hypothetical protein